MPTDSGFSNQKKLGISQFETVQELGSSKFGKAVSPKGVYEITPAAAIVSVANILGDNGQTQYYNIEITSHGASVGNVLRILTAPLINFEFDIMVVPDANHVYILPISPSVPAAAMQAEILGWVSSRLSSNGDMAVAIIAAPTQFNYDGAPQTVEQDTVVPANNRGMPSLAFIYIDGVQYPVGKDTGTPANTVSVPVEVTGASGPINITAGDINVQLTDLGANFDRTRIGNGTDQWEMNASGEGLVHDADVLTELTTLNTVDFSTEAKQDDIITELTTLNSVDFATEAKQDAGNASLVSIDGKLPSTLGQKAMAASLAVVLASDQSSIPVSIGSSALPTGAATEAKQDAGNASLVSIDGKLNSNFGVSSAAIRTAAQLGNATGSADFNSGAAGAQTLRSVLATRHEAAATPLASRESDGTDFLSSIALAAAQLTTGALTKLKACMSVMMGWDGTTHRELAVDTSGNLKTVNQAIAASYQEDITVTTGAETFTAPAGAKNCVIQCLSTNTVNIRVKIGGATATTSSGYLFEPGRSEMFPFAGNISYIAESSSGQAINVHFGV